MTAIFLDLYGVLADGKLMDRRYNERMSEILWRRYGGGLEGWQKLQWESYAWYQSEGAKLDAQPGDAREGDAWVEAVRRMNAEQVRWMFDRADLEMPPNPAEFAEQLEAETVCGIDALFADAKPTLVALKERGYRLFLSTNANRSNAESALIGGGIRHLFDGLAMLETARAKKDRPYYWRRAFDLAAAAPEDSVVVDDQARFLRPVADLGATCVQLLRPGRGGEPTGPWPVIESLAALRDVVG